MLVDLGGPGSALFGSDDLLAFAAAWPKTGVLVFIEEPWVTRPVAPRCTAAISRFYRGLRGAPGGAAAADGLVSACDVARSGSWGWTPESYRRVVAAILAKEKLSLVGVVGSSYGAVHVEAVWSRPSVRWAILSSPAPRSATGAEYLAARRESAMAAVTRACKTCRSRRGTEKLVASAGAVLADAPVELRTRTPLVEPVDLYAALIATAYLSPAERDRFVAGLRSPRAMASEIGLLSDTTLLRYGEFDMSPAVLAYLDEVCRRYPSWPQAPSRGDGIGALLVALHRPCLELAPAAASSAAAPNEVCVAVGGADAVTPPAFARTWLESVDRARLVRVEKAAHGSPELARSCLRP